jgi:hypothetical protein
MWYFLRSRILDDAFKMCDDWLNAWFPFHSDCVNLPVIDPMFRAVILRGIKHMLLFDSSDIFFFRKELPAGSQRFKLHENCDIALLHYDIYFPVRCADVARDDLITAFSQPFGDYTFASGADLFFILYQFAKLSKSLRRRTDQLPLRGFASLTSFS